MAPSTHSSKLHGQPIHAKAHSKASTTRAEPHANVVNSCLCLFDVDRVLTSSPLANRGPCPGSKRHEGISDGSSHRTLITSALFERLHDTFCGRLCHIGILTAGTADGFQAFLWSVLRTLPHGNLLPDSASAAWLLDSAARAGELAPFLYRTGEGNKEQSVAGVLRWLLHRHNVSMPKHRVFFFDDKSLNVRPFATSGFNARQVSCATRDFVTYDQGYCGGVPEEVLPERGVRLCKDPSVDLSRAPPAARTIELPFFSSMVARLVAERDEAASRLSTEQQKLTVVGSLFGALLLTLVAIMFVRKARL